MGRGGQIKEFKHDGDVPKVHFSDVKGCDEAKSELEEIVAYLQVIRRTLREAGRQDGEGHTADRTAGNW